MSDIALARRHNLEKEQVRDQVQQLLEKLVTKYGGSYDWDGEHADYCCSGVEAKLGFDEQQLHVEVKLSFMMKAFKKVIEQEITQYMDDSGMC